MHACDTVPRVSKRLGRIILIIHPYDDILKLSVLLCALTMSQCDEDSQMRENGGRHITVKDEARLIYPFYNSEREREVLARIN